MMRSMEDPKKETAPEVFSAAALMAARTGSVVWVVVPRGSGMVAQARAAADAAGVAVTTSISTASIQVRFSPSADERASAAAPSEEGRPADQLEKTLLRTVTHELRTPLTTIKAGVSGLRQTGATYTEDDRAELLAGMEAEVDRLNRLVSNMLDASRLEAGALRPRKTANDFGELVSAVVERLQPLLAGRRVELEIPDDLPLVRCDYAQIDQVLTNLLENAAVHTEPPAAITVRATLNGDLVQAEVIDQGPGVPPEDRERIFRPFERGRLQGRGSGLGLAVARGLVEAHGGRLWVEDAPGCGATFCFELPAQAPPPHDPRAGRR